VGDDLMIAFTQLEADECSQHKTANRSPLPGAKRLLICGLMVRFHRGSPLKSKQIAASRLIG